jgi:hypothetical protein
LIRLRRTNAQGLCCKPVQNNKQIEKPCNWSQLQGFWRFCQ